MDRHDRPYKCLVHGCQDLKGFATPGDFRRHEIWVHKLHGAPQLNCPFSTCKRHTGKGLPGFTNLALQISGLGASAYQNRVAGIYNSQPNSIHGAEVDY
jgi:hypothetical protein